MKLVSVTIPYYNRINYLQRAINSVYNQTYRPIELLLINDGGTPIKPNKLDLFQNKDFIIIHQDLNSNQGPGAARKRGRHFASGDFIAYLDSDDYWDKNFISTLVKGFDDNTGMVFCGTESLGKNINNRRFEGKSGTYDIRKILFQKYYRPWTTSSCIWNKDVSLQANWHKLRNLEDYLHDMLSAEINHTCKYINIKYIFNDTDAESRILRSFDESIRAYKKIFCKIKDDYLIKGFVFHLLSQHNREIRNSNKNAKIVRKLIRENFKELTLFDQYLIQISIFKQQIKHKGVRLYYALFNKD